MVKYYLKMLIHNSVYMNCIFITVFFQEKYIELLFLLLESLFFFGKPDNDTEILIYTSEKFKEIIIKNPSYIQNKIKFEINNDYNSIEKACCARLDLFELNSINKYEKILYLDTDIIIANNINSIFNICDKDILYVLEEGNLEATNDFHGQSLFGKEINNYNDKSAFSSGIMLFKNCESIKDLFLKIKEDMSKRYHFYYDQPFIVYNAFKYRKYNNKIMKNYCINYHDGLIIDQDTKKNKFNKNLPIHHFPIGVGKSLAKYTLMENFFNMIKKDNIIECKINETKKYINDNLLPIIKECNEKLEGNIFMEHLTNQYTEKFINKVKNIALVTMNNNNKNILEIGFNSGFSALLMLLSNPEIKLDCYDIGEHKYTGKCYERIKKDFGKRLTISIGDSTHTLKNKYDKYDLIHIDGGHSDYVAENDIINSYRMAKQGSIIIMDDYNDNNLKVLWDKYIIQYNLKSIDRIYETIYHDIKMV